VENIPVVTAPLNQHLFLITPIPPPKKLVKLMEMGIGLKKSFPFYSDMISSVLCHWDRNPCRQSMKLNELM
jgi:hypothetical protein